MLIFFFKKFFLCRSCFLIFDSLSVGCSNFTLHSGYRVVQALHDYLRIEFQAKRPDQVSTNPFNRIATRVQILRVPQQNNAIDCGVFLLKYAECFMKVTFEILKLLKLTSNLKLQFELLESVDRLPFAG